MKEIQYFLIVDGLSEKEKLRMEVVTDKELIRYGTCPEDLDEFLDINNWETFFPIPNTRQNRRVLKMLLARMSQEANLRKEV
jgi:hypothetical protein